jgi:hypothetical protein
VGNSEGKRPLGWWVDDIKMNLAEIGWGGMDWINLAQDRETSGSIKCSKALQYLNN